MAKRKCRAKDPATCRSCKKSQGATVPTLSAFEKLERQAEQRLAYKRDMLAKLAFQRTLNPQRVTETVTGWRGDNKPEIAAQLQAYNDEYDQVSASWTESQKEAMHDYTGLAYMAVNKYLRDPDYTFNRDPEAAERVRKRVDNVITNLDAIFASTPVRDTPRTLYRIVEPDVDEKFTSSEDFAQKLGCIPGTEVNFKAYTSTTLDPDYIASKASYPDLEHTSVVLQISTREGVPVDRTADERNIEKGIQAYEREVLLPRNRKYRVARVSRHVRYSWNTGEYTANPLTVFLEEIS